MTDYLTSLIRTYVPMVWGSALAWLVKVQIIDPAAAPAAAEAASTVLVPIATGLLYALARWLEAQPWMPRLLVRVLLGSPAQPAYADPGAPR